MRIRNFSPGQDSQPLGRRPAFGAFSANLEPIPGLDDFAFPLADEAAAPNGDVSHL